MKKIHFLYIIIVVIIFLSIGCPGDDEKYDIVANIKLINNSTKPIIYLNWYNSYQNYDTLLRESEIIWEREKYKIEAGSFVYHNVRRYQLPNASSNEILMFYFFDSDTLELVPWERISRENKILKRIDFHSLDEMEAANFEVAYP
jgi:hypothetical protein